MLFEGTAAATGSIQAEPQAYELVVAQTYKVFEPQARPS
jgi:hypothetical protein